MSLMKSSLDSHSDDILVGEKQKEKAVEMQRKKTDKGTIFVLESRIIFCDKSLF